MREVKSDTNFDPATCNTEPSIRMMAATVAVVTDVSVDYLRSDWIYVVSIYFRPLDAPAD